MAFQKHRLEGRGSIRQFVLVGMVVTLPGCTTLSNIYFSNLDVRPPSYAVRVQHNVEMTTSDDVRLVSDVFRPKTKEKTPTILVRVPMVNIFRYRAAASLTARHWAQRGYTVVVQGARGRYKSSGQYYPLKNERQDGIETLAWIASQPWYDGRLGMWGLSSFGHTQWAVADQPGISAFMIQISSSSFYDMFYPGGAFSLEPALFWALRIHHPRDKRPAQKILDRGYPGFPLIQADDRVGTDLPHFNDWASHPTRDAYWLDMDGQDRPLKLAAPVHLTAGWFDPFLPGQVNDFNQIQNHTDPRVSAASRLVIGPWAHAASIQLPDGPKPNNYRKDSLIPSVDWFDRHLGAKSTFDDTSPVRIYVMGDNVWRNEQEWPLARTRYLSFYLDSQGRANTLHGDGQLGTDPPPADIQSDTYIYDPNDPVPSAGGAVFGPRAGVALQNQIERRKDVLVYTTDTLVDNLEVTGPVKVILYVSTTAPSTDFTAKLVDVHANGNAYNVSDGILRRSYVAGRQDQPVKIEISLWPTSMVFKRGHKLRLEISSSNYPRYDRNPNTGNTIAVEDNPTKA